ncbi:MAG: hypothetical protein UR53_C0002G0025 [Candidatus Magasanikbacteria bacterium GW2011_GWC2_34_16]|uniref:Uncharacterized protein n=2 Tax=Candidatus Magasanikiibacteriota TaxID=1752731 RepID=A0A0G0HRL8_9BACT|nr:MAG: hypothetical protein UR53_C0002G0025 [Candidatus Magasanikbacteria bacterium GW2011_GWC2_34_16]KKQ41250.1 MAG: hypothetical protein US58_C0003G0033 [Candidatus Magasanikbacteria bacterium GW2011_GWA2_37_8]
MPAVKKQKQTTAANNTPTEPVDILSPYIASQKKPTYWLWIGVIGLAMIIFGFWIWSLSLNLAWFNWKKTPENNLLKQTRTDWDQLFTAAQIENQKIEAEKKIKEIISQIEIANTTTTVATTTTSTTINTTTNN